MSGCDTTCALYNQVKKKILNILKNNAYLENVVEVVKNTSVDAEEDTHTELLFLVSLYESSGETPSLKNVRYRC